MVRRSATKNYPKTHKQRQRKIQSDCRMTEVTEPRIDSFPLLLFLSRRLEYIADSELKKDDLTTKQYLTVVVIETLYDHSPSISELAQSLSTTHQNIKQIALQLQKKGFIKIERDENDKRTSAKRYREKQGLLELKS